MPTSYPTSIDVFTNPTPSDLKNSVTVPHASQHANVNDAVEALEVMVGTTGAPSFVAKALYDAFTVLAADSDDTPLPLTMAPSTALARLASGGIVAATPAQMRTLLALGNSATLNVGTVASTVAAGDDARFTAVTHNTQTASYVLVLTDAGKLVEMNVASANTLTFPPNATIAIPVGSVVGWRQYGAGQITMTPGSGVTLRSEGNKLKSAGQYAEGSATKRATDEWVLAGALVV